MTMVASIHGRTGRNTGIRQTRNGQEMADTSVAVDVTPGNAETPETLWVKVLAFGSLAVEVARCTKGEMLSAVGRRRTAPSGCSLP
jgi:single-strand DNA-binding protein